MVELGRLGFREHQPHVTAHEEGERAGLEQVVEAEPIAIERDGLLDIVGIDRDLPDPVIGFGMYLLSSTTSRLALHPLEMRMLTVPRKGGGPA